MSFTLVVSSTSVARLVTAVAGVTESIAHTETNPSLSSTLSMVGIDTSTGEKIDMKK